ncbi:TPA: hypothetical protein CPT80_06645 [Candidatus Gastranaerophilales bacterium HUM_9]|nr:MAG TPA: hypothetical protein CPT80_06645 [Candidatus Gastranaerophilales bacterium HUM_9]HBX35328.1 hypothetical protein [Cyanobacteria bacterium UBA11440]
MLILILLIIIVGCIFAVTIQQKQIKETKKQAEKIFENIIAENNFNISKSIDIHTYSNSVEVNTNQLTRFLVDDNNKQFAIISYNTTLKKSEFKKIKYSDLINFNLFEDGEQQIQGKGMMAAGGALLFGLAGAVIGSVAGGSKIKNKCSELSIRLQINDLQNPLISLVMLSNTNKNSIFYKLSKQTADEIIATLTYIENNK